MASRLWHHLRSYGALTPAQIIVRASATVAAVVLLIALIISLQPSTSLSEHSTEELRWQNTIRELGAKNAYAEFVQEVKEKDIQVSHTSAHIFGAALYATEGKDGIVTCDDTFAFGCLHEMFERIISDYGIANLAESVVACKSVRDAWHPCHHALGHGLIAYLGYDEQSVLKALEICADGFNEDPINGCVGGVFMEFNLYTSAGPVIDARPVGEQGWFYPCTAIEGEYHKACYFWLPQWWRERMLDDGLSGEPIFKKMGELCRTLPHPEFEEECFQRVGQHATYQSKYKPTRAQELCMLATDGDERNKFLCHAYSAFSFRYTDARFQDDALSMCSEFTGEQKSFCEKFARNEANIGTSPPLPQEFLDR